MIGWFQSLAHIVDLQFSAHLAQPHPGKASVIVGLEQFPALDLFELHAFNTLVERLAPLPSPHHPISGSQHVSSQQIPIRYERIRRQATSAAIWGTESHRRIGRSRGRYAGSACAPDLATRALGWTWPGVRSGSTERKEPAYAVVEKEKGVGRRLLSGHRRPALPFPPLAHVLLDADGGQATWIQADRNDLAAVRMGGSEQEPSVVREGNVVRKAAGMARPQKQAQARARLKERNA